MSVGDGRVRKNTVQVQQLLCEFRVGGVKDGESVEDFALRLNDMVAQLPMLDDLVCQCPNPGARIPTSKCCVFPHPR